MNIEYLKNIDKINLEMLPPIMAEEYNKFQFRFDTEIDGTYFSREAFNGLYAEISFYFNKKVINQRLEFNQNLRDSMDFYREGFSDAFFEENFLIGITKEEDQIFEVFSRVHKKLNSIFNPAISSFKKNISVYNELSLIERHLYDYGYEVGTFMRAWAIILNNISLFEKIFAKYYGKIKTQQVEKIPFKIALLFAKGEVYVKKTEENKSYKYYHLGKEFNSVSKLSSYLGLSRQYFNDTLHGNISAHNLYLNLNIMESVITYCNSKMIDVDDLFLKKFNHLKEKQL
ncbi:hypothetical protein RB619_05330 [Flavobacterium sp. LHD-80]|uniref:hypothetical protein n=1 Tax=Flavobacterium sp. LHD-80 TaxID=3071411 RepID=UPI0027E20EBF|nr:hypothetical protein [Flavobacterium sp. LHD-80]MDQ6470060.1 hypothetical protein [Flavobacterium sp. LHD-80]